MAATHNQTIVDQFTKMAIPFGQMHSDEESTKLLIEASGVSAQDSVLDVACGPGLVACAFAAVADRVTGIDITPAMIDEAKRRQAEKGLSNIDWRIGDVAHLPFPDGTFSIVLSRYALHHMVDPAVTLREMARVCQRGGGVVIADVFVSNADQDRTYNQMEKLRDHSHVRALPLDELVTAFQDAGLRLDHRAFYRFPVDVDHLLRASCTSSTAAEQVRKIISDDIGIDRLGIMAHRQGEILRMSFPVVVLAGKKL
ncbi:MAG TPA: methyltransferase domain-containing protein [Tepidisphaeraceae bacterium]|nr:methyltransferase domain-containing protein [Tepidisphaeraceae bacterium]